MAGVVKKLHWDERLDWTPREARRFFNGPWYAREVRHALDKGKGGVSDTGAGAVGL